MARRKMLQNIPKIISDHQNEAIQKQPNEEEVKKSILLMKPNKAPNLDEFPIGFFQTNWDIVGKYVWYTIKEFFKKRNLLK